MLGIDVETGKVLLIEGVKEGGSDITPSDYNDLLNLPKINGILVKGNKTNSELDISYVYDIGSQQSSYQSFVIPKLAKTDAQAIYTKYIAGKHIVLKWTFLGSETYLNIISADYIAGVYSLDVAIHNQYHIAYSWDGTTGTYCNFEVNNSIISDVTTTGESGTLADDEIASIKNDANIINDGEKYYLCDKRSDLTYRTYINLNVGTNTNLTAKAIYVQLNEEAVNYGTWSKEDLSIGN